MFGQVGVDKVAFGRLLPEAETISALRSRWRRLHTPESPYRAAYYLAVDAWCEGGLLYLRSAQRLD